MILIRGEENKEKLNQLEISQDSPGKDEMPTGTNLNAISPNDIDFTMSFDSRK